MQGLVNKANFKTIPQGRADKKNKQTIYPFFEAKNSSKNCG